MDISAAITAFAAIAQHHRLRVFKRLMEIAPEGLTAGDIARELDIPASTLSTHLAQLKRTGLLRSWRHQRHIFYTIDMDGTRRLVDYLINDCCRGHPELCGFDRKTAQANHERPKCKPDRARSTMAKSTRRRRTRAQ
jgi:ArsR family transcriptional regulator